MGATLDILLLQGKQVIERQLLRTLEYLLVEVIVYTQILCIKVRPDHSITRGALGTKTCHQSFLGNIKGCLRLRHILNDTLEGAHAVIQLIHLSGSHIIGIVGFVGKIRSSKETATTVSQASTLANLLEYDAVHAATKVFII